MPKGLIPEERLTWKDKLLNLYPEPAKYANERKERMDYWHVQAADRWGLIPDHITFFVDLKRCIGCFSCETHCKLEHDDPMGPRRMRVMQIGPKRVGRHLKTIYYPMNCFMCGHPACVEACPTGALIKRAKDGIVYVDSEKCIGCKRCMQACPFGAIQWDSRANKVIKCDYCIDRIDRGLQPACATKCTTHCIYVGNPDDIMTYFREKQALKLATVFMNGRGNDTLCSPCWAFPEKNFFVPPIRRKPGALLERVTRITPAVKLKAKAKK
jgi:Fe-S-cluster-containing dehydrogenase component